MLLRKVSWMTRELVALGRNYRHAAIIRRHVRAKYGAVLVAKPSVLVGEVLLAMDKTPWKRFAVLAVLLVAVVRR